MMQPIEFSDDVYAALYDPSPLDRSDTQGISLHETLAVGRFQQYLCLYETSEGFYARRGQQTIMWTKEGARWGAVWAGTIEIPKHNYEKFTGKLERLGIFESKDFFNGEGYLDGVMYELRAKSASQDGRVTWVNPEGNPLQRLLDEIERLLRLPKDRFEKISRFDRAVRWFKQLKS